MKKFLCSVGFIICLLILFISVIPGVIGLLITMRLIVYFSAQTRYPLGGIANSMKEGFVRGLNAKRDSKETMH